MKNIRFVPTLILLAALSTNIVGCKNRDSEQKRYEVAVTNSYLQCVVDDICQSRTSVLCLTPPGMCPGHFDISPAQVNQLCKCRVLLRFDFQEGIDTSLLRMKSKGLKICSVRALAGLCVPDTYFAVCKDVCNILSTEYPDRKAEYKQRLKLIEERLDNLSDELHSGIRQTALDSAKVLASNHQSQFCKWLGLEVIATFVGRDTETVSNINQCLEKARKETVRFIIANRQGGTALADTLAERLGAKVAVFSNFPDIDSGQDNFDRLLQENVQTLLEAVK